MTHCNFAVSPLLLILLLPACASSRAILFASAPLPLTDTTTIEVFAMQPDGSERRQLTRGRGQRKWSNFPVWSPDGRHIAYQVVPVGHPQNRTEIHIMDGTGGADRLLVRLDSADAAHPEWSPDGTRLLFTAYRAPITTPEIYTIRPDGSDLTRVPVDSGVYGVLAWEPDGRSFLTSRRLPSGRSEILRVAIATGQSRVVLKSDSLVLAVPSTAPDGSAIVMQGALAGASRAVHVFLSNADGTLLRRVTPDTGMHNFPRWSHDGRYIVMQCSMADLNVPHPGLTLYDTLEVCTVTRNGKRYRRVTRNSHTDVHPSW
ncbi:MAG: hypothetical protein AB1762_20120 [Gemmatimonadota bacterium]